MKNDINCKHCGEPHNPKVVARAYGEESSVFLGKFCSAQCYTKHVTKVEPTPINWISVSSGQIPPTTEEGKKETYSESASSRVLIFCSDGIERFGRYFHKPLEVWNVEGCTGIPEGFVTHFAYLSKPVK